MQKNMKSKRSKAPTQEEIDKGWSENVSDIRVTFHWHSKILLLLVRLGVINWREFRILNMDFQQDIWSKIRDGE